MMMMQSFSTLACSGAAQNRTHCSSFRVIPRTTNTDVSEPFHAHNCCCLAFSKDKHDLTVSADVKYTSAFAPSVVLVSSVSTHSEEKNVDVHTGEKFVVVGNKCVVANDENHENLSKHADLRYDDLIQNELQNSTVAISRIMSSSLTDIGLLPSVQEESDIGPLLLSSKSILCLSDNTENIPACYLPKDLPGARYTALNDGDIQHSSNTHSHTNVEPSTLSTNCQLMNTLSLDDMHASLKSDAFLMDADENIQCMEEIETDSFYQITEQDMQKVELFYRSYTSEVIVCRCLANLYIYSSVPNFCNADSNHKSKNVYGKLRSILLPSRNFWRLTETGIPLLVIESDRNQVSRRVSIVLAEKGTGFPLWTDVVNQHTYYYCDSTTFHTMRSSTNSPLHGFSFDNSEVAANFAADVIKQISNISNDSILLSKVGKEHKKNLLNSAQSTKKTTKYVPPSKMDISRPCCFQHVTNLQTPTANVGNVQVRFDGYFPTYGGSMSNIGSAVHNT